MDFSYRLTDEADFEIFYSWMISDHVKRWYYQKSYEKEVLWKKYGPRLRGETKIQCYIIEEGDRKVGFIQFYKIENTEEFSGYFQENAYGFDIFIGNTEYLHKGHGQGILEKFLQIYLFQDNPTAKVIIGTTPENVVSKKLYQKMGFKYWKIHQTPGKPDEEFLILQK